MRIPVLMINGLFFFLLISCYPIYKNKKFSCHSDDGSVEVCRLNKKMEMDGKCIVVDQSGNLAAKGRMKNNHRVGKWRYFDDKGRVYQEKKYNMEGEVISTKLFNLPF